jgi:hypothetical protein
MLPMACQPITMQYLHILTNVSAALVSVVRSVFRFKHSFRATRTPLEQIFLSTLCHQVVGICRNLYNLLQHTIHTHCTCLTSTLILNVTLSICTPVCSVRSVAASDTPSSSERQGLSHRNSRYSLRRKYTICAICH